MASTPSAVAWMPAAGRGRLDDGSVRPWQHSLEIRLLGPFEVVADGGCGRGRLEAGSVASAPRAPVAADGGGCTGRCTVGSRCRPGRGMRCSITSCGFAPTLGHAAIAGTSDGYSFERQRGCRAVRGAAGGDPRCVARRRRPRGGRRGCCGLDLWRGSALQGLAGTAWFTRRRAGLRRCGWTRWRRSSKWRSPSGSTGSWWRRSAGGHGERPSGSGSGAS